ncbi:hypothetical protein SCLCIDRAFT_773758 [Scleroderma citrinum Foug A]|uniref:Uncharacterized protein n=1 Tax=Scleroderma citrinum Foug A TaxID=1036808 RepID=A0A0C3E4R3_9AGAM|nr:hypothetical protein SCLCIDRAFT_773758 [Scleroderma citrinum Foug A]
MSQQNSSVEFPSSLVCASFEYTPIFDLTELQLTSKSPLERLECITKHELKKSSKRRQQRPDGSATSMGHPRSVAPPARVSEHKPSVGLAKTDKPLPPLPPKHPVSTRHRPSKDCYKQVDSILAKARRKRDERTQGQLTQREPTKTDHPLVYRRNSDYELHHLCPLIPISRASCSPVDISPYHNDTSDSDVVELDSIVIGDTSSPCDNSAPQAGCNIPGCDKQLVEKIPSPSCSCSGHKEAEGGKRRSCCVAEPPPSPFYDGTVQGAGVVRRRSGRWSVTSKSFRRRWSGLC